jgi:general secretion pathway protein G
MSLVEVMVVIAIVLTLMSVLALGVMGIFAESRQDTTRLTVGRVGQQIFVQMLGRDRPPGVEDLAKLGIRMPVDGWGRELLYRRPGRDGAAYEVVSLGRDGEEGGDGLDEDIVWVPDDRP